MGLMGAYQPACLCINSVFRQSYLHFVTALCFFCNVGKSKPQSGIKYNKSAVARFARNIIIVAQYRNLYR